MFQKFCNQFIYPPPPRLPYPTVSVVIPMYNAEEFIGECLESVLHQTFQSFEVIVVDDCSTDDSAAVVESYVPKFDGRLRLVKTKKNSGGGGYIPRNIGLTLANGEYVWFIDADDFILLSALETLYSAAKEHNADIVYTGIYFRLRSPLDFVRYRDGEGRKLIKDGLEDKTVLRVDDQKGNLNRLLLEEIEGNFRNPWSKFLRRKFLIENNINFPQKITNAGDFIWVINVYCHAGRFLRLPTPLYFYRSYNTLSVTQTERAPEQQISHWISSFVDFVKSLRAVESENEILSKNPAYCFSAFKSNFEWCLYRMRNSREELSGQDIYKALYQKFAEEPFDSAIPFFFSFIDTERKINDSRLQTIKNMEKEVVSSKISSAFPAVSVIIALYNAEKYVAECLDSLLAQTFQNFEVIVVDDCSTDNSVKIVESYMPKFGGRLTLTGMEKNSGGCALPRNKALSFSRGEYLQCLDADDTLTKTALEEMYTLARDYDADVVYCEKHYQTEADGTNLQISILQKEPLVSKPTLESADFAKRMDKIFKGLFVVSSCFKFVRRKLMVENEIFFPHIVPSEDDIWTYGLIFYAKRFLRVPNAVYIRRLSENSTMRKERTPQQEINFWLNPVLFGAKSLDKLISKHDFFKTNLSLRYELLKKFIDPKFWRTTEPSRKLSEEEIYSTIKDEFGEKLGDNDVLIPALCTALYTEKKARADERKTHSNNTKVLRKFARYFTARLDIKFIPKTESGDFQIFSVSNDKVKVTRPEWLNRNGIGYTLMSYLGELEFIAKATVDGQIQFAFRGIDLRDPNDKSKRIPCWIDYTKFTVNEQTIFDSVKSAWHDKPYRQNMEVKADEEITVKFEWLPHRSDT